MILERHQNRDYSRWERRREDNTAEAVLKSPLNASTCFSCRKVHRKKVTLEVFLRLVEEHLAQKKQFL